MACLSGAVGHGQPLDTGIGAKVRTLMIIRWSSAGWATLEGLPPSVMLGGMAVVMIYVDVRRRLVRWGPSLFELPIEGVVSSEAINQHSRLGDRRLRLHYRPTRYGGGWFGPMARPVPGAGCCLRVRYGDLTIRGSISRRCRRIGPIHRACPFR